jgi:copper(I)-binding protein
MKYIYLLAALLAAAPALAWAQPIEVKEPWARATPPGARTGVVYLTLLDRGSADMLTGASTPVADMAMLHESYEEGGVAKMRMVEGVALPAGKPVRLAPGGKHLMLTGLKQALKPGETFPLTLTFAHAPAETVQVHVLPIGATGPASAKAD